MAPAETAVLAPVPAHVREAALDNERKYDEEVARYSRALPLAAVPVASIRCVHAGNCLSISTAILVHLHAAQKSHSSRRYSTRPAALACHGFGRSRMRQVRL